jgi:prepilin-type N-terminal cleavage/methylation domain-containing protein
MKRLRRDQGLPASFMAGFTKLELLVVIVILGISTSLVLRSLYNIAIARP